MELDPDRNSCLYFTDRGTYTSDSPSSAPSPIKFSNHGKDSWKVSDCYGYHLINAYSNNGKDIKDFCNTYSGSHNEYSKIRYITDSECASYVAEATNQPFLKSVSVGNEPVNSGKPASFADGTVYMIKNVNSINIKYEAKNGIEA